jgi:hypothetical protein
VETNRSRWDVNVLKVGLGIALIVLLTKATDILVPDDWYFSFSAFLFAVPEETTWQAVVIKLLIPVIVGIILGFLAAENPIETATAAGFSGAFLLTWPAVVDWTYIIPEELSERRGAFLIIYLFYFAAYAYLSRVGSRLTLIYLAALLKYHNKTRPDLIKDLLDWKESVRPLIIAGVASVLSYLLSKIFAS